VLDHLAFVRTDKRLQNANMFRVGGGWQRCSAENEVASGCRDTLVLFDVLKRKDINITLIPGKVETIKFSPDGSRLAVVYQVEWAGEKDSLGRPFHQVVVYTVPEPAK
jgi:hypothetical protein